ncbi:SemiSWEET transporter [Candidatus Odyssella thessalonicensis]|uniref:SemiSWEET transporter n=1 Tax=Candidatus Odyssella thessalonicensis TaxID=84647 RepID=UPI000225BAF1|nr:SemiSWEET transporter [Candidatus Odyssella thessalonicensis]
MSSGIELIGLSAGMLTTLAFLPQVIKVIKTHSVKNISVSMYIIFCLGLILWIIYGIYLDSTPIIIANTITLVLAAAILIMKIIWDRRSP